MRGAWVLAGLVVLVGCDGESPTDAGPPGEDAGASFDAGPVTGMDSGAPMDAGPMGDSDAGPFPDGRPPPDPPPMFDAGSDAGPAFARSWGAPAPLEMEAGQARDVYAGMDSAGDAFVAFSQLSGGRMSAFALRYTAGGFGAPVPLESTDMQGANVRGLAVSGAGDAIVPLVMTRVTSRFRYDLFATRLSSASGSWGPLDPLSGMGSNTNHATAGGSPNGNAAAVWVESGAVRAARYVAGSGWSAVEVVRSSSASMVFPAVAVSDAGAVFAAWTENPGSRQTWAARFDPAMGSWSTPARLDTDDANGAQYPRVALRPDGSALVVWEQDDSFGQGGVWVSIYDPTGAAWSAPAGVESDRPHADRPEIATDATGDATVAWVHDRSRIFVSTLPMGGSSWSTPVEVATGVAPTSDFTNDSRINLGADTAGDVMVAYEADTGSMMEDLRVVRFDAAMGVWEAPVTVAPGRELFTRHVLAVAPAGQATLAWTERTGGMDDLWAARFE